MKLYFHPFSGSARRALMTVVHLDVPVERIMVDLQKGEQRGTPHLSRNPNGRVPVLDDDGFLLWESRAIMQYLADKTPGQTVYPTDLRGRADVNRWLFWCAAHMTPANATIVYENFVKPMMGKSPDPVEVARGMKDFAQYAAVLDAQLAGKTWILGDRVTLADLSIGAGFHVAKQARQPIEDYPNLGAWLDRLKELDAWKKTQPPAPPGG